ncbi:MAG: type II secretion system secretin GspD [Xanthomonadaceae bacterium]|jgi:general secretion pathway protein D|nr:type II secretion system secretin GspD [Xanthomonadaceae bacterium]
MKLSTISISILIGFLAACASTPVPDIRRSDDPTVPNITRYNVDAPATSGGAAVSRAKVESLSLNLPGGVRPDSVGQAGASGPSESGREAAALMRAPEPEDGRLQPQVHRGTGEFIDQRAGTAPPPALGRAGNGTAVFNFEGESLQAVVKAILGDMLGQNYVIAPTVQGTVTLGTPKPVSPAEALSLLEMILSWNNARMVYSGGRYNIVPAAGPLDGSLAPRTGPAANANGYEARVIPLRFISATEMKKVLEPYARPNAIVGVDSTRNIITLAGTRTELENYLRTVQIFDVDWLKGMSVGVFPLQSGRASRVVEDLERVFGQESSTPSAGMFRFMPLEGANAVLVITPQESYLDRIQQWLDRIDSASGGARLFSYELKYIRARDLALRLAEVFGAGRSSDGGDAGTSLMPGAEASQINSGGLGGKDSGGSGGNNSDNLSSLSDTSSVSTIGTSGSGSSGGLGSGSLQLGQRQSGNASVTLEVDGGKVGVSAVEETNSLLIRATPQAWRSIKEVIDQLDVMPTQVHIEAQVAEVELNSNLTYGVNWFLKNATTTPVSEGGPGLPDTMTRNSTATISGILTNNGMTWTLLGSNGAAIIRALDAVTKVHLLQTPSIFVRNNAEATLNVGSRIPISSVSINTGGNSDNTYSTVQYIDTGIILKVRPRVTRDGMVFLDIVQEVSSPGAEVDNNGNVRINTRRIKTEAAVREGNTVLLAGLISDSQSRTSAGLPGLSRIPILGGLFGTRGVKSERSEMIVLLTPTIVRNAQDAVDLTDEYGRRFRALDPIYREREAEARAAEQQSGSVPSVPSTAPVMQSPPPAHRPAVTQPAQ